MKTDMNRDQKTGQNTDKKAELLLGTSMQMSLHLSEQEIRDVVSRLAGEISQDYAGKRPILLGVLKGAFIFLADLVREIEVPLTVDFIRAQSYKGTTTSGEVVLSMGDVVDVRGQDVLVVEDIVDTGTTVKCLLDYLAKDEPASLKLCALLDKPSRRETAVDIDYLGFIVPDRFVVGYGTDLNQSGRNLPGIYALDDTLPDKGGQDA